MTLSNLHLKLEKSGIFKKNMPVFPIIFKLCTSVTRVPGHYQHLNSYADSIGLVMASERVCFYFICMLLFQFSPPSM